MQHKAGYPYIPNSHETDHLHTPNSLDTGYLYTPTPHEEIIIYPDFSKIVGKEVYPNVGDVEDTNDEVEYFDYFSDQDEEVEKEEDDPRTPFLLSGNESSEVSGEVGA